jgi:hypothetical protein
VKDAAVPAGRITPHCNGPARRNGPRDSNSGRRRAAIQRQSVMPLFALPKSTRGQWLFAGLHIGMLAIALVVAWQKNGPPLQKAFWAIMSYFVEMSQDSSRSSSASSAEWSF